MEIPLIVLCTSSFSNNPAAELTKKERISSSIEILLFFTPFSLLCFDLDQNPNILKFPVIWISENVIQKLPTWRPVVTLLLLAKVPSLQLQLRGETRVLGSLILALSSLESQNLKSQSQSTSPGVVHLLNLVWGKCLVSGSLTAIQPCLGFCWGSLEPTRSRSHIPVCETDCSVNCLFCLINTAYLCTKSLVWYISLPIVPPLE